MFLREKIFAPKLRSTPKSEIFLQDKEKSHGRRQALPWHFDAVLREKILFGAYKSLCEAALLRALFMQFRRTVFAVRREFII